MSENIKNISDKLCQYTQNGNIMYQVTLPCKDDKTPQAHALPFYGYKWMTFTEQEIEALVADYLKFKSTQTP